jgi:hypothetical protein
MLQNNQIQNSVAQVVSSNGLVGQVVLNVGRSHRKAPAMCRYHGKPFTDPAMRGMPETSRASLCRALDRRRTSLTAADPQAQQALAATARPAHSEPAGWDLPATIWAAIALAKAKRG